MNRLDDKLDDDKESDMDVSTGRPSDRTSDREGAYDALYGLLVALCDRETCPPPNLMAAFNLLADTHHPAKLCIPRGRDSDQMLGHAVDLAGSLFWTSTDLAEKTRLSALRLLIASAAIERPDRGRPI